MSEELCHQCPYKNQEKALLPCNACLGNIPYAKLFDEYLKKILGILPVGMKLKLIEYGERDEMNKKGIKILHEFYVKAQIREFELGIKNQILDDHHKKIHSRQPLESIKTSPVYCKHCQQLTTGMEVIYNDDEVKQSCSNCGTIYGQEGP